MFTNPILKNIKNLYLYFFIWILNTLIYFGILTSVLNADFINALAESIVYNLLLCGLGLSYWYSARYISFENNSFKKIILSHLFGGILAAGLWLFLGYFIIISIPAVSQEFSIFFYNTLPWRFLIGILFYFLITAFYYIIIYYSGFQERTEKESELKNLVTESELKSLKFQINPHFIFNSLNSMSALTTINPDKAKEMILKLADFLRYTLANNDKQKTKLAEELKNIKLYLDIERIRFEDKFDFEEEIEKECLNIEVPNMLLQPLFENAIKHAVYETLNKVTLKLKCFSENNFLRLSLENNFDSDSNIKRGTGVGLNNIQNRLRLIYGYNNLFEIKQEKGLFKVNIFIPLT